MSAIEYGSYYWCVILNSGDTHAPAESVFLHADQVAVDQTGALTFLSRGRRQAGAEPAEAQGQPSNGHPAGDTEAKREGKQSEPNTGMIYFAFAPGTWKFFYAAKLQDGAPASVEHWNMATAPPDALRNVGANDFVVPLPPK